MNQKLEAALYFMARLGPAVVSAATIAILTRLLAPAQFGIYALSAGAVLVANATAFQWLRLSVLRFSNENRSSKACFLSTVRALYLLVCAATAIAIAVSCLVPALREHIAVIGLCSIYLFSLALTELTQELLRAEQRPVLFGSIALSRSLVALALTLLLVPASPSATTALLATAGGAVVSSGLGSLITGIAWQRGGFNLSLAADLWAYGAPLTGVFALEYLLSASDRYLISSQLGVSAAGLYAAAYDYPRQALSVTSSAVALGALPRAIKSAATGDDIQISRTLSANFSLLFAVVLASGSVLLMFRENIATVLLGIDYRETAVALQPLIVLGLIAHVLRAFYFDHAFQLAKRPRMQLPAVGLAAVVNIALNFFLLKTIGIAAAAWATIVAYALALAASAGIGRQVFALPVPWAECGRAVASTLLASALVMGLASARGPVALIYQLTAAAVALLSCAILFDVAGLRSLTRISERLRNLKS